MLKHNTRKKKKKPSLLFQPFLNTCIYYQAENFPKKFFLLHKLYSIIITMTILATAPSICKMGPCQKTDKNLFYFKSLIPVFIAGNRISCLKRKLYYNYVSNWMSLLTPHSIFFQLTATFNLHPLDHFQVTKMGSLLSGL